MWLQIRRIGEGLGPGEVLVAVTTHDGCEEQVIVHISAIIDGAIEVGRPLHQENGDSLVELPREAMSGRWRVWVPTTNVAAA